LIVNDLGQRRDRPPQNDSGVTKERNDHNPARSAYLSPCGKNFLGGDSRFFLPPCRPFLSIVLRLVAIPPPPYYYIMTDKKRPTWGEAIAAAAANNEDQNPKLCAARASCAASLLANSLREMFDAIEDADLSSGTKADLARLAYDLSEFGNDGVYLAERFDYE